MASQTTESKKLLSYTIAEWACALKYEHLSPEAVQAAKLFWFDSIGCALGGSQQDDAKILLKHYRAMSATADSSGGERDRGVPVQRIGKVGGDQLQIQVNDQKFAWPIADLYDDWWNSIRRLVESDSSAERIPNL